MLFNLALILFVAWITDRLFRRVNIPGIVGQMIIGLILGPSMLGIIRPAEWISALAEIGVIVLMFLAGLETNPEQLSRARGPMLLSALGGVFLPLVAGTWLTLSLGANHYKAIFMGTILTATSVSVTARTLLDIGQLRSTEGTAILGAAVVDDVVGIVILTVVLALAAHSGAAGHGLVLTVLWVFLKIAIFFAVAWFGGRALVRRLARRTQPKHQGLLLSLAVCFLMAVGAEAVGVAAITGAYLAGLILRGARIRALSEEVETVASGVFVPVFFFSIGAMVDVTWSWSLVAVSAAFSVVAVLSKALGSFAGARVGGLTYIQSLRVGVGMVARGEVALITATIGLNAGLLAREDYPMVVAMVLVTTLITPLLLRFLYPDDARTGFASG